MFLLDWLRQYKEIRSEYKDEKTCSSCETLKLQLAQANDDRRRLLDRLLEKPEQAKPVEVELKPVPSNRLPFSAIRQRLEAEDRQLANQLRQQFEANKKAAEINAEVAKRTENQALHANDLKTDVDALEEELVNARTERESRTS